MAVSMRQVGFLGQETRGKIWARDRLISVYLGCNENQALVGVRLEGQELSLEV